MDKKEGKKPCKDAPTTVTNNNNNGTSSSRVPNHSPVEQPRDRRNLEAIRKKRKEEEDAREQARIKRRQQRDALEGGEGGSLKEQNDLQRAIQQSLVASSEQQERLDGSPGPSGASQHASTQVENMDDAKERSQLEQALRQSREAYASEQSCAGDPPVKDTRPQQSGRQVLQAPTTKATHQVKQTTATTTNPRKIPASPSTVRKPTAQRADRGASGLLAPETIQPLSANDQERLDRIRTRLETPAAQRPRQPSVSPTSSAADVTTASASTQNLRAVQDQLASYQRQQRELQQRRQVPLPSTDGRSGPSLSTTQSSVRPNSTSDDDRLFTRPMTIQTRPLVDRPTVAATIRPAISSGPVDTIAKPLPVNQSTSPSAVVGPRTTTVTTDTVLKPAVASNRPLSAAAANTQCSSITTQATSTPARTPLPSLPSLAPSRGPTDSCELRTATPFENALSARPPAATQRTVLTGNISQALTQLLVPASAENSVVQQRPSGMPTLASIVEDIPRASEGLPEAASQAIAAQAQGTAIYPGINAGGAIRQIAETRGAAAVRQFETILRSTLLNLCPMGFQWLNTHGGYICAGGNHFVLHASIDMWASGSLMNPGMHPVNILTPFQRHTLTAHPPPVNPFLNVHGIHRRFMMQLSSFGVVVDDAEMCPCIRAMGFTIKTPAEVEALEDIVPTLRKVFPGTGLFFGA